MIIYLVFAIIVAILFSRRAKKLGLPTVKWGWIGFGGALASCVILVLILAVVDAELLNIFPRYIEAPGYVIFPLSAIAMFLVYRKWLPRADQIEPSAEPR